MVILWLVSHLLKDMQGPHRIRIIQVHPGLGEPFRPVSTQLEYIHIVAHLVLGEII